MNALLKTAACLLAALAACPSWAADIGIMPVAVQLDRAHDRATVQVINNGSEPVVLQADAIAWKREAGIDSDGPTGDLIVNPPVFTVQPGQVQIVRVGLRRNAGGAQESTYRMVLREVPQPLADDRAGVSGNVRVLMALRVPVYVAPNTVARDERWTARRDGQGNIVASVVNAGNVHYKVGAIRLHDGQPAGGDEPAKAPVAEKTFGAVLFPGEGRSFQLPAQRAAQALSAGRPMTLEVLTDRGLQHVALELASN